MPRELSVELEAVTPLFLGGAEQDQPEARAASFRGALRFWWRALAAEPDVNELRRREAAVFGDTKRASPVRVDIDAVGSVQPADWQQATKLSAGRLPDQARLGLSYLGFALAQSRSTRRCLPAGTRLRLTLRLRRGVDEDALRQAGAALWLLLNLGGIGTRSRRGFGGLTATTSETIEGLPSWCPSEASPASLARHLTHGLAQLRGLVHPSAPVDRPIEYPILTRRHSWVVVLRTPAPSWQEALGHIGQLLAVFRKPLYPRLADLGGAGATDRSPDRAAFGLPIQYYRPGMEKPSSLTVAKSGKENVPDRHASPLLIKVAALRRHEYDVVLTVFSGFGPRFLPDGVIGLQANGLTIQAGVPAKPLGDFLTRLADTSQEASPEWPGSPGLETVTVP